MINSKSITLRKFPKFKLEKQKNRPRKQGEQANVYLEGGGVIGLEKIERHDDFGDGRRVGGGGGG